MQTLYAICQWLEHTSAVGVTVRESIWIFPVIETIHLFGVCCAGRVRLDFGFALAWRVFQGRDGLIVGRAVFALGVGRFRDHGCNGRTSFSSEATKMYDSDVFRIKMLMIATAGLNAFVFHSLAYQSVGKWERDAVAPLSARFAGTLSILLWFGIVGAGRWIAYA